MANQIPTSSQATPCSTTSSPTVVSQLTQGSRPGLGIGTTTVTNSPQMRQTEYLVILPPNPRQPGVQALRYPIQAVNINNPNLLQSQQLIRTINPSQLIRTSSSSAGGMQPQNNQAQITTMANIQGRHVLPAFGPNAPRGHITLQNGQIIPSTLPIQRQMMTPRATILQQPILRGVHPTGVMPTSPQIGMSLQTTTLGQQPAATYIHQGNIQLSSATTANATPPSLMTPEDALLKGNSFFQSLIFKMAIGQKKKGIPGLIQSLIDGKKNCQEFAQCLQKEMNSGPQNQLVPFLELLLPHMRQALDNTTIKIPGLRGPNQKDSEIPPLPQLDSLPQTATTGQSDESRAVTSSPNKQPNTYSKKKKVPAVPGQKTKYAIRKELAEAKKKEKESLAASQGIKLEQTTSSTPTADDKKSNEKSDKPKTKSDKPRPKQKKQEKQLESLSSTLRDDDDVNDVAAMGGVNLAEESQKIMASGAELVGTQIRSCKDEPFLDTKVLTARIARITKEYNLPEPSKDVVTLISHATQERLKTMVERLGALAEHRSENLKLNSKYEVSTDIKGQMKFLAELDRIEKRRYEEQERELLLKVAKSRSKVEDPEQQKLRQKAKDMQRAEQDEVRQREANETALLAIGPRKKMKTSTIASDDSFSQVNTSKDIKPSVDSRGDAIRRIKRVNMRDLQVLLELDRTHLNHLIKLSAQ